MTLRFYLAPVRMATIKKTTNNNAGEEIIWWLIFSTRGNEKLEYRAMSKSIHLNVRND
jgi:hypothetical protein